jgi:5'(3')-deoxyribonucleotidase
MPRIFVDMDGVVADFNQGAAQAINASSDVLQTAVESGHWDQDSWKHIVKYHPRIFRDLPKMPKADLMMELASKFRDEFLWDLRMLTAVPKGNDVPDAFRDKIHWMSLRYPGIPVWFGPYSQDKKNHCLPGDILIDDRKDNCEQWQAAGGLAVRVTSDYDRALEQLESIYHDLKIS